MMTSVPVVEITTYFSYFASKTKASIPAASGAADEVPLNTSVHLWWRSVVTLTGKEDKIYIRRSAL